MKQKPCFSLYASDLAQLDGLWLQCHFIFHRGFDLQRFLRDVLPSLQPLLDHADANGRPRVLLHLSASARGCSAAQVSVWDSGLQVPHGLGKHCLCCAPAPFESQKLKGFVVAVADCILYVLSRLFFKALQGTLFPTPLQLGRQLAKRSPRKFRAPRETSVRGHILGEARTKPPGQRSTSVAQAVSQDCSSRMSRGTWQPACSPEAGGEPSAVDMGVPRREGTLPDRLGSQPSRSSSPGPVAVEGCPGGSRMKPMSASRPAPLPSVFSVPGLSSLNWMSSLSLVGGLGGVLQFSRSSLPMDKHDGDFLPSSTPPERDLCGSSGQTTDCF